MKTIIPILSICFLLTGCGGENYDKEKAKDLIRKQFIKDLIKNLTIYKRENDELPNELNNNWQPNPRGSQYIKGKLYYQKEGVKDKAGNKWLIIYVDKKTPNRYFVGNLDKGTKLLLSDESIMKAIQNIKPIRIIE